MFTFSNAERLQVKPRVGRLGLPSDTRTITVNVKCGAHFMMIAPSTATYFERGNHSWHIGDRFFARDLAITLEGAIDRHALPIRKTE
ncbi:hypothetical protein FMN50_13745 [Rhodobacterales bacterium]|nr:hypothetical protein FMN50_13745 [Rhodobacterales bacterium]